MLGTKEIVHRGERRCRICGKPHDAYAREPGRPSAGHSWADPNDGHVYDQESWEEIARRLGFKRGK